MTTTAGISALDASEWALLREQVATIQLVIKKRYSATLDQSPNDLDLLQRLLDDRVYDETDTDAVTAMGAVLGNVLERQHGLKWHAQDDGRGRTFGVYFKGAKQDVFIAPGRLLRGHMEAGTAFRIADIVKRVKDDVARCKVL
ncbi:MAG: DUF3806 domain-containing protein [Myxococcales bacterium]|nr:DUF3806 domain-containing protein [Myxococcales bacterium]